MKKYIIILILFISSCSIKENKTNLIVSKSIKFRIDSSMNFYSWQNQVKEIDNNSFLFRRNSLNNEIVVYNISDTDNILKRIKFKKEGVNSIPRLNGFHFHNWDSIFVSTSYINTMYLSDSSGTIYNKVSALNQGQKTMMTDNRNPFFFNKNKIYSNSIPPFYGEYKDVFNNATLDAVFDFNLDMYETTPVMYPKEYLKDHSYWSVDQIMYYRTYNPKRQNIIYSFPISDSLLIYDLNNSKSLKKYSAKSQKIKYVDDYKNAENAFHKTYKYTQAQYSSVIYDIYRDIYYRVAILPSDNIPEIKNKRNRMNYFSRKFSIITLDSNFNIISEDIFSEGKFNLIDFFVDKEGLWISSNLPNLTDFDENYVQFKLFKLETI